MNFTLREKCRPARAKSNQHTGTPASTGDGERKSNNEVQK
jgi:hypothetical protein